MNEIASLLANLNIEASALASLAHLIQTNPMAAIVRCQELGLTTEFFPKLLEVIRKDPQALASLAESLNIDSAAIAEARQQAEHALSSI